MESSKRLYKDIKDWYYEMKVACALQKTNVKVVDEAAMPGHIYIYSIPLIIALSVFFGLEHMDSTVRDREEGKKAFRGFVNGHRPATLRG